MSQLGPHGWRAALLSLATGVLGAVVAVLSLVVHQLEVEIGDVEVPWGLLLAVAGSVLGSVGVQAARIGSWPVLAYGVGWCVAVLFLLGGRPEGDYLVPANARGWGFLVAASLGVVAATLRGTLVDAAARRQAAADPDDLLARRS